MQCLDSTLTEVPWQLSYYRLLPDLKLSREITTWRYIFFYQQCGRNCRGKTPQKTRHLSVENQQSNRSSILPGGFYWACLNHWISGFIKYSDTFETTKSFNHHVIKQQLLKRFIFYLQDDV